MAEGREDKYTNLGTQVIGALIIVVIGAALVGVGENPHLSHTAKWIIMNLALLLGGMVYAGFRFRRIP